MKNIFLILTMIISFGAIAQVDSSKIRISGVKLTGRESDCMADVIRMNPNDFPIMDSVIKVLYITKPNNNDTVTFNSVPNKEWMRMIRKVRKEPTLIIKDIFKEIRRELLLHGGSFIASRIIVDDAETDTDFDARKKLGQDYAQKKDEGAF